MKVPVLSMVFMAISLSLAFLVPIALMIWLRVKKKANFPPFFIGMAVMLIFALVVESLIHQVVALTPFGKTLQGNIWLYALYGGFMAGLFEETGRYLAMKTVLKRYQGNDANALMYGAGHGGIECIVLLGLTMVNNLIYSVMINTGNAALLTTGLPEEYLVQVQAVFTQLAETPSGTFLLGMVERLFAIVLQLGFSVLVWFGVKNRKFWLCLLAFLCHLLVDGVTAITAGLGLPTLVIEGIICVMAVLVALLARLVWKKEHREIPAPVMPAPAPMNGPYNRKP